MAKRSNSARPTVDETRRGGKKNFGKISGKIFLGANGPSGVRGDSDKFH